MKELKSKRGTGTASENEKREATPETELDYKLYEMQTHEELCCNGDLRIIRVPGGWIYRFWDCKEQVDRDSAVFVPCA